jgi:inorganic pyrophosphatase
MTDLLALPAFADSDAVHVVIESPRGSTSKFKYDAARGIMTLSRPLTLGLTYPFDWGFVPSTCAPDGDPLDAFVMWDGVSYPGVVLTCRPIGVLRVDQADQKSGGRERNDRIAVLPVKATRWESIESVFDTSERTRAELERFFQEVSAFEGKDLKLLGWGDAKDAVALVRASQSRVMATR